MLKHEHVLLRKMEQNQMVTLSLHAYLFFFQSVVFHTVQLSKNWKFTQAFGNGGDICE